MKPNRFFTQVLAAIIALGSMSAAEKEKRADVSDYPFYTAKKRGAVAQFVPGLTAALGLTSTQVEQIAAAREAMGNDEGVRGSRGLSKSDPSVTAEQREKARAAVEAATARLREQVAGILTPEQKALIEKISATYAAAAEEAGIAHEDKFGAVKNDEAARRRLHEEIRDDTEEQFRNKLNRLLTTEQKEAMARAAEEEERRNAKTAGARKPVK